MTGLGARRQSEAYARPAPFDLGEEDFRATVSAAERVLGNGRCRRTAFVGARHELRHSSTTT